jgi:hypothetical protein
MLVWSFLHLLTPLSHLRWCGELPKGCFARGRGDKGVVSRLRRTLAVWEVEWVWVVWVWVWSGGVQKYQQEGAIWRYAGATNLGVPPPPFSGAQRR